ncbi:D-alanyl-D-alanine carboxypeptidase family protein [Agrobacterium rosae]|uniref:D-alanyl-D-alanine carboxypeptidase family protein n=1 Tax=Agrobacterium rosae TaxID=1972867 RepID=A0AAW9F9S1_9HYPH|nr:D-alanyl-D-alanine carboxypeptidase family protein [Agrobacterium rosae]MDX8301212.1 D-alanyl-D-alanine carboxypeptidase family protein [Agrobacterium rosae]
MNDEQRLVVSLEARMNKYEKDMTRARNATNDNFKKMEGRARQSAQNMEKSIGGVAGKIESMFTPLMRGGAMVAGIGAAAIAVKQIADSVAEVDREARKAGVSAKVWQQWTYVATGTGMSIDGVTDALKELNIRGDEFAKTGKGSAEEAFQRLGYSATDVAAKLRDPSHFLDEIIGKLQTLDAAAQTRILDEIFGGTGAEQMAKVLGMSVAEIQKMRSEAATFTDEQIESAKRIDREFSTMWRNFTVYAKQAAVEGVNVASRIIGAINDPSGGARDKAVAAYNTPEQQLKRLQAQRDKIVRMISDTEANPFNVLKEAELRQLRASLSAVDDQIHDVTGGSDQFKEAMKRLSAASNSLSGAMGGNVTAAANFKTALTDLKKLVPELKAELDSLATTNGIDAAYQRAVGSARSMGQVLDATNIANRAKTTISVNSAKSDPTGYLEANLASGKDRKHIDGMASAFAEKLATMLASMPDNLKGDITINSGYRDIQRQQELWIAALKKYGSPEAARKWVAPPGNSQHNRGNAADLGYGSDAARQWAHKNAGNFGLSFPLGNENWHIEDADARNSAKSAELEQQISVINEQNTARKNLNMTIEEGLALARFEQSISGMSASQQRIELAVYQAQQEAKRAGIVLTDQELAKIREKITLTQQLDGTNQQVAASADGLKNAQQYFAESFTSSLSGLLTGTQTLNGALQNLLNSLIDATLQAALLGKGPLAGMFGGAGTGLLGSLFGFADGGYTGNGGKYEPAGVVHRGEYVMSKKATSRIGVGNLEAMHRGALGGFAEGGFVGNAPAIRTPDLKTANDNAALQAISINAPITVNGSAGTPEQNNDLAGKMAKQLEAAVRGVIADEMRKQSRPGAFGNTRSR